MGAELQQKQNSNISRNMVQTKQPAVLFSCVKNNVWPILEY
jgi:hypothetical protein